MKIFWLKRCEQSKTWIGYNLNFSAFSKKLITVMDLIWNKQNNEGKDYRHFEANCGFWVNYRILKRRFPI